jgi:hypothetical protein
VTARVGRYRRTDYIDMAHFAKAVRDGVGVAALSVRFGISRETARRLRAELRAAR